MLIAVRRLFVGLLLAAVCTWADAQEIDPIGLTPTPPAPAGMAYASDAQHRVASHACGLGEAGCAISLGSVPAGIARSPQDIASSVRVLVRRGTVILYVPEVAGAADFRAYVVKAGVTFSNGDPRGAVLACAGFRQHPRVLKKIGNVIQLERARQFELPLDDGNNLVVIEAIDRPCPFVGALGHKNGTIPVDPTGIQNLPWIGSSFPIVSFDAVRTSTGNEILNGQGAASAFDISLTPSARRGQPVPYVQPRILARATFNVTAPASDEALNAPLNDLEAAANQGVFDDFSGNETIALSRSLPADLGSNQIWAEGKDALWNYWVNRAQKGNGDTDSDAVGQGMTGAQIWKRHGRLFITQADFGQESMTGVHFTSRTVPTRPMDGEKYIRSFFRVDGNGTQRRYWHWMLCGSDSDAKLVQPAGDRKPLARYNLNAFFYSNSTGSTDDAAPDTSVYPGVGSDGVNPTVRMGEFSRNPGDAFDPRAPGPENNLECLQLASFDGLYQPATVGGQSRWYESGLRAVVNPRGKAIGLHSLISAKFTSNAGNADQYLSSAPSHYYGANPSSPLLDNFLLPGVPAHFDVYVRRNRVVVYVNGRQGVCWNLDRPLLMDRAKIVYGQVLYHTRGEAEEIHHAIAGYSQPTGQFHYVMNMPAVDTRTWDLVGESHGVTVPDPIPGRTAANGGFDESQCVSPDPKNFRFPPEITAPPAPAIASAVPGNGSAMITISPPSSDGGSPITVYTVNCSGPSTVSVQTTLLTGVLNGLTNGVAHTCTAQAVNALGASSASAPVVVTPGAAAALALFSVESRKNHATLGTVPLPVALGVPLNGNVSVEPRRADPGHMLAFRFGNAVTSAGVASVAPVGSAVIAGFSGNDVIVQVNGVPDRSRATVSLTGVNGVLDAAVSLGFFVGDVNGRRNVNAADIAAIRANASMPVTAQRARFDLDLDGAVGAADAAMAKSRAGQSLP